MPSSSRFPDVSPLPLYDVTARKAHQWAMLALLASGFLIGGLDGAIPVAIAGGIMLVGRFWWPADVVRQFVWRVLEPRGVLRRFEAHEDHETRRIARVMGGLVWIASAALIVTGITVLGWALTAIIAMMVFLDASFDFCGLCFAVSQLERRGLLPAS